MPRAAIDAPADLCAASAAAMRELVVRRAVSSVELVSAHLARIEELNPAVNALVTLVPERALAEATERDRALARGEAPGLLHGVPVGIKDLVDTAGIRTTYGSPIYAAHVPERDALHVERLRRAGAVVVGKTNTPEFGAGAQTFNPVFGATRNPYDPARTSGGSSGGAAAAVAAGMLPFADGSDLASSVRNPASYCNVVGLRPAPGRVPTWPADDLWDALSVVGPIARTSADALLLLRAMSGPDPRAPLALDEGPDAFGAPLETDLAGTRVAWSPDLGDLPVEPEVVAVLERALPHLEALGCTVEAAAPDLAAADEAFHVLRALSFVQAFAPLLPEQREQLKETIRWNVDAGLALDPARIARAQAARSLLFERMRAFLEAHDALALPTVQTPPFPLEVEWPRQIAGVALETYIDWLRSCSRITMTAHPAVSVPAGFTADGLPVGLQLVGRHRGELALMRVAHAFERAAGCTARRPALSRPA